MFSCLLDLRILIISKAIKKSPITKQNTDTIMSFFSTGSLFRNETNAPPQKNNAIIKEPKLIFAEKIFFNALNIF
jgi:hypothetical protein